jgi:hypothetical protein
VRQLEVVIERPRCSVRPHPLEPAAFSASSCRSNRWSPVETLAYPSRSLIRSTVPKPLSLGADEPLIVALGFAPGSPGPRRGPENGRKAAYKRPFLSTHGVHYPAYWGTLLRRADDCYLRHSYELAVAGPAQLLAAKTLVALPQGLLYRVQRTLI